MYNQLVSNQFFIKKERLRILILKSYSMLGTSGTVVLNLFILEASLVRCNPPLSKCQFLVIAGWGLTTEKY